MLAQPSGVAVARVRDPAVPQSLELGKVRRAATIGIVALAQAAGREACLAGLQQPALAVDHKAQPGRPKRSRHHLRLAHHWAWLNDGQYAHVSSLVAEIGKLLGGWIRQHRAE